MFKVAAGVGNLVRSARHTRESTIHRLTPRVEDHLVHHVVPRNHLVLLAVAEAVAVESTNVEGESRRFLHQEADFSLTLITLLLIILFFN